MAYCAPGLSVAHVEGKYSRYNVGELKVQNVSGKVKMSVLLLQIFSFTVGPCKSACFLGPLIKHCQIELMT